MATRYALLYRARGQSHCWRTTDDDGDGLTCGALLNADVDDALR